MNSAAGWNPLDYLDMPDQTITDFDPLDELEEIVEAARERLRSYKVPADHGRADYTQLGINTVGIEVGDNRVTASTSSWVPALEIVIQSQIFRMKTSEPDTYVSTRDYDLSEGYSLIPRTPLGDIQVAKKTSMKHMEYFDHGSLRTMILAAAQSRQHSYTNAGKSDWISSRLQGPREEVAGKLHFFSWLQDGFLDTPSNSKPKYLPRQMGGSNCPPLFGNYLNSFLYLQVYKNGTYSRVYGSSINELMVAVDDLDKGIPASAPLTRVLAAKGDYLHLTWRDKVLLEKRETNLFDTPPLYEAAGNTAGVTGFEGRMFATKRLIPETEALVERDRADRMTRHLFSWDGTAAEEFRDKTRMVERSKRFDQARSGNSAVQRLLAKEGNHHDFYELVNSGRFDFPSNGVQHLDENHIFWLYVSHGKGKIHDREDVRISEAVWARDEVSMSESMKGPGVELTPQFEHRARTVVTTVAEIGLWKVPKPMEDWADQSLATLKGLRDEVGGPLNHQEVFRVIAENPEWVKDDEVIFVQIREKSRGKPPQNFGVVTADRSLCYTVARVTGNWVTALDPSEVVRATRGNLSQEGLVQVRARTNQVLRDPGVPALAEILVDTGNVQPYLTSLEEGKNPLGGSNGTLWQRTLLGAEWDTGGYRTEVVQMKRTEANPVLRLTVYFANDHHPLRLVEGSMRNLSDIRRSDKRLAGKTKRNFFPEWKRDRPDKGHTG